MSLVSGHGGCNKAKLAEMGITFKIKEKSGVHIEIAPVNDNRTEGSNVF